MILATLPPHVLVCMMAIVAGLLLSLSAIDEVLLKQGARRFFPEWFNSLISERDLFDIWIDFVMENNPIMALIRLAGKSFPV